jgi:hypothetical protein
MVVSMLAPATSTTPLTCSVCGSRDARTLSSTTLESGAVVVVCGSHALAHARLGRPTRSVSELRATLKDRRATDERRLGRDATFGEPDELAEELSRAFSEDRRSGGRRSADT